jgi:hypothetical protein
MKNEGNMRYIRLKLSVVLLLVLGLKGLQAQESVIATGGNGTGSSGSVSFTVGQIAYQTFSAISGSVNEGVQQPFEISVVSGIEEAIGINLSIRAYPNPSTDNLTLSIDEFDISGLSYQLYDMQGRLLQSGKIIGNRTSIIMNNLVPSTYFVKVLQNYKVVITHKVIKN